MSTPEMRHVHVYLKDDRLTCFGCKREMAPKATFFLAQSTYKVPPTMTETRPHAGFEVLCPTCFGEKFISNWNEVQAAPELFQPPQETR